MRPSTCGAVPPVRRQRALKDAPYVMAALAADQILLSLDEQARTNFADIALVPPGFERVANLQWANPQVEADRCSEWLAEDCPFVERLRVANRRSRSQRKQRS